MSEQTPPPFVGLPANDSVDTALIRRIVRGDEEAFGHLWARYYPPVFGFLFKALRSREDAEDIVQEVFVRLWNRREDIGPGA